MGILGYSDTYNFVWNYSNNMTTPQPTKNNLSACCNAGVSILKINGAIRSRRCLKCEKVCDLATPEATDIGNLEDVLIPRITAGQLSDFERRVRNETADMVLSALIEVLKDKTSTGIIDAIVEDLKVQIYDL